jgi:putative ABC transport system ATP-binding protein
MEHLVALQDVTREYTASGPPALDALSMQLASGSFTAVMGPSGSGKSTLLNLIGGLDRADAGSMRVAGLELTRMSEAALARYRRETVGLIFQFFNLLDNLTVLDNVAIPARLAGMKREAALSRARELLERLGIAAERDVYPARLSGGQRQRVAIARALVNRPRLLLADEPTGALDSHNAEEVMELLCDLNRAGQTVLLVTHDERLAARCAAQVIRLEDGRVASSPLSVAAR